MLACPARKLRFMLDVRRLRLLREVAARRTIAAAAAALQFTPSAVSQQLSALEREAGVALLERDGRGLRLTDAARRLVAHTEVILADLERAEADLAGAGGEVRGLLRVAAFPTAARAILPTALAQLSAEHPGLRVTLREAEPHESLPQLRLGELDLALVHTYDLLPRRRDEGLAEHELAVDEVLVALPPGWPVDQAVRLSDLADQRWIGGGPGTSCHAIVLRACALAGYTPEIAYTSNDFQVVLALVEAGLGVALVPRLALHGARTSVVLRPVAEMPLARHILATVRAGSAGHPALAALLTALGP